MGTLKTRSTTQTFVLQRRRFWEALRALDDARVAVEQQAGQLLDLLDHQRDPLGMTLVSKSQAKKKAAKKRVK